MWKMQQHLCNELKPVLLVYIIYIQIVVINSKTSILWKLNAQSGYIEGFSECQRHVRKSLMHIYARMMTTKSRQSFELIQFYLYVHVLQLFLSEENLYDDDPVFGIISATENSGSDGSWNRLDSAFCDECIESLVKTFE